MLPRSATHPYIGSLGVLGFLAVIYFCRTQGAPAGVTPTVLAVAAYGVTILLGEFFVLRAPFAPENGLRFSGLQFSLQRVFFKTVGLVASVGMLALLFWMFPEYHYNTFHNGRVKGFYLPFGDALQLVAPVFAVLAIPYIALVDAAMKQPEDHYYWLGRKVLFASNDMSLKAAMQHLLPWLCRGYFVALLFVFLHREFSALLSMPPLDTHNVQSMFELLQSFVISLSLTLAVSGQVFVLRLMGTHIRSIDPTLWGWWVCSLLFQPFKSILDQYLALPQQNMGWLTSLDGLPFFQYAWAVMLLVFMVAGLAADVSMGSRYGQLVHRGIITSGPYRFTKHPSYVASVLLMLFTFMPPLIYSTLEDMLHAFFAISGITLIYYLRARTEERHLAADPDYVAYALWIEQHGIFRWVGQLFPVMRFAHANPASDLPKGQGYVGLAYS